MSVSAPPLPPDLEDEVVSFEMQPATVAKLMRGYVRSLAERLESLGRAPEAGPPPRRPLEWLHPRTVWAARIGVRPTDQAAREPRAALSPTVARDLVRGEGEQPWIEHLGVDGTHEPWCDWARENLERYTTEIDKAARIRYTAQPLGPMVDRVEEAFRILWNVWPEAAIENHLLVRAILYVEGGEFQSATFEEMLGAVLVGLCYVRTVPGAFEMLLHEGGHHSLFLRNTFATFVTNGADLVHHPLREDPRPVKGAVHAAHALARMSAGLSRWCAGGDAPAEAFERRDTAVANFRLTLAVLEEHAHWTEPGARYFSSLKDTAAGLPVARADAASGWD